MCVLFFFFSSRRRHTRCSRDWSSDVCSSDLDLSHASLLALSPSRPQRRAGPCLSRVSLELGHFVPLLAHFPFLPRQAVGQERLRGDRKSTRLNSSHGYISYAVFCLKKKTTTDYT